MKKGERTTKDVMADLISQADFDAFFVVSQSGRYGINHSNIEKQNEMFAEQVGQLVLSLPESDRELLKEMSSEDILSHWMVGGIRFRPKEKSLRKRGPVSLTK